MLIHTEKEHKAIDYRLMAIVGMIVLMIFILAARLYYLQIASEDNYITLSDRNRIRVLTQTARRGDIYDRHMEELATSKPVFAVALASSEIQDREALAETLAPLLEDEEITPQVILEALRNNARSYEPVVVKRYPYEEGLRVITRLEEMREQLPGMLIMEEPMRYYPFGSLAGHILGTVGLLSPEERNLVTEYNYQLNDWLGKSGLERVMERYTIADKEIGLRGVKGIQKVEVNSNSRTVRVLSNQSPVSGNSLVLTLDAKVQAVMEQALEDTVLRLQESYPKCRAASAVLLDVRTGGVIAQASYPSMNPNDFANGLSREKAPYYMENPDRPMVNRTIAAAYPPGSTFKAATAAALMASGKINTRDTVVCTPSAWRQPRAGCHGVHGTVNFERALAVSCNTYFQEMGYRIGIDQLYKTSSELGFGTLTGIELPGELAGVLPNPEWKKQQFPEDHWEYQWRNYDTFYMSMGQGANMVTPLQLANYVAAIANGGERMQPYLVDRILSPEGQELHRFEPMVLNSIEVSQEGLNQVRKGMRAVVEPGGTASSIFRDFPVNVAAKTGTAQTGLPGDDAKKDYHGVFVAFAPYESPEVAFACLVEYGYRGGTSGGVVCREVFEEYFQVNPEPLPDDLPPSPE